ncbi:unnamed protein product [Soboliphyme baturini]|uniref:Flavodoxin-like domain-containing protein n=1 Tax=Soboliphyme baturini TaxID=241478 RepID=A0A183J7K8_9BILA|nr:unnamed protein product [Soboliphyme baturini]
MVVLADKSCGNLKKSVDINFLFEDEFHELAKLPNNLAIFCMATYGDGDPTDNAVDFKEFLKRRDVDLSGLHYAVFGLGNKTYEHFNAMGKLTDKRLAAMKAHCVCPLGLGDDDGKYVIALVLVLSSVVF